MSNLDELAKAFGVVGHATRLRIVLALREGECSPRAVAAQLDEDPPTVAHHFRVLLRMGLIRQTRTAPARGRVAHFYVLTHDALELLDRIDFNDRGPREN